MGIRLTWFLMTAAVLAGWPCLGQGTRLNFSGSTNCTMADFDFSLLFASGDFFNVTVKQRNLSNHSCTMDGSRYLNFQLFNQGALSCYDCPTHSLQEAYAPNPPVRVEPGQAVQQTFRWRTSPQRSEDKCIEPKWMTGPVPLYAPALLTKVCPNMEVSRMTLTPEPDRQPAPQLRLTSLKPVYDEGETYVVHVSLAPGEPLPEDETCPKLYLRERSPDGTTRIDEVRPMAFQGCRGRPMGYVGHVPDNWTSGFDVYSGANNRWFGVGEHSMDVFQLWHSPLDSELHLVSSNAWRVQIVDPATLPRKWAGREAGLRVDLTLDKSTFTLGEDVPLHIAVENGNAAVPIYGVDPRNGCGIVSLQILDRGGHPVPPRTAFPANGCLRHLSFQLPSSSLCAGEGGDVRGEFGGGRLTS